MIERKTMPRHLNKLDPTIIHKPTEYELEKTQSEHFFGSLSHRRIYSYTPTKTQWLFKSSQPDLKLILRKKIAIDIYAYYGVTVRPLKIVSIPSPYDPSSKTGVPCLLSPWAGYFSDDHYGHRYDYIPTSFFNEEKSMQLTINGQLVPEQGLGHILAVAHFIQDTDVIGRDGANIGYKIRLMSKEHLYARSCKIDSNPAFDDVQPSSHLDNRAIYLATTTTPTAIITFEQLAHKTQQEFLATLIDIIHTPPDDIRLFFHRSGTEILQKTGWTKKVTDFLQARKNTLAQAFQAEIAAYQAQHEAKETKLSQATIKKLKPTPTKDFYINQWTNTDNRRESASWSRNNKMFLHLEPVLTQTLNKKEEPVYFDETLQQFLQHSKAHVLLLLGDPGLGKSTAMQQIIQTQWEAYLKDPAKNRITLRIQLRHFNASTVLNCVERTLQNNYRFTLSQITALKQQRCLILLDGFDEIGGQAKHNLWDSNKLAAWSDVRLIVTCRSNYLAYEDIAPYFYPSGQPQALQQRYLMPFDAKQIEQYASEIAPTFSSRTILGQLQELLEVPLTLKIFLNTLPALQKKPDLNLSQLDRFTLYQTFMQQWFTDGLIRKGMKSSFNAEYPEFLTYLQTLAFELFRARQMQVDYAPKSTLLSQLFNESKLANDSPLRCTDHQYSFTHTSFYEFFLAQGILGHILATEPDVESLIVWLGQRPLKEEPQVLLFLQQAYSANKLTPAKLSKLFNIITSSRANASLAIASSNAGTILNCCGVNLSGLDWHGVQLPGADFSYGHLVRTNLSGANLSGAILRQTILSEANLAKANLQSVQWGEWPYPQAKTAPDSIVYYPNSEQPQVMAEIKGNTIVLTNTQTQQPIGTLLNAQTKLVSCIAFSPNGRFIVSGYQDATLILWDVATFKMIGVPRTGHRGIIHSVAFSPSGEFIISASVDQTLRLWSIYSPDAFRVIEEHLPGAEGVVFSLDGKYIIARDTNKTLRQWSVNAQPLIGAPFQKSSRRANSLAFDQKGALMVAGGSDGILYVYSVESKTLVGLFKGDKGPIYSVAFSPDGTSIVSGGLDRTLCMWNIFSGVTREFKGHEGPIYSVAFSPDGKRIVSGSSNTLRMWDITSGATIHEFKGHTGSIYSVAFSPDGKSIVSGSSDHSLRIWNITSRTTIHEFKGHKESIYSVAFSPDGRSIVSGGADGEMYWWNIGKRNHNCVQKHDNTVVSVIFSPDGKWIVSGDASGALRFWDNTTGACSVSRRWSQPITSMTLTQSQQDKYILAVGDKTGVISFWDFSPKEYGPRFLSVLTQPAIPLLVEGIQTTACHIDDHGSQLLAAQHVMRGMRITPLVTEEKTVPPMPDSDSDVAATLEAQRNQLDTERMDLQNKLSSSHNGKDEKRLEQLDAKIKNIDYLLASLKEIKPRPLVQTTSLVASLLSTSHANLLEPSTAASPLATTAPASTQGVFALPRLPPQSSETEHKAKPKKAKIKKAKRSLPS